MPGFRDAFRRISGRGRKEPEPETAPAFTELEPPREPGERPVGGEPAEPPALAGRLLWETGDEDTSLRGATTADEPGEPGPSAATAGGPSHTATAPPPEESADLPQTGATRSITDDDILHEDHLLLACPYCGLPEQRVGSRCEKCNQVIVRLPTWAQHRRQSWFMRRLSLRRIVMACVIVLFIVFVVWVNYPFAPNPVVLFKRTQSQLTIDADLGAWSAIGRDLRNSRQVMVGPPPPAGIVRSENAQIPEPLESEPVAQSNNIYVGSASGVYALAHHDLTLREGWDGDTPGRVTGTLAVVDAYLFFGSTDHTVNAWNALTGDVRWTFTAADTVEVSPVVSDGLVYISSGEGWVYALDAQDGSLIWKRQLDSSASAAVAIHEGRLFVGDDKGIFYILSARTGQEWFRYRTPRAITGPPVISSDGQRVYFASGGQLYAVDAKQREIPGLYQFKQIWAQLWLWQVPGVPRPKGQQGGLWRFTPDNPLQGLKSSPALTDDADGGTLYVGGHDHILYALDSIDGSLLWTFDANEAIWASPLIVKDQVIFGDDAGIVYSLNRETGEESWRLTLPDKIRIAPVLSNGQLLVRTTDGAIFAID